MYLIESGLYQGGRPGLEPHNKKLDPTITAIVNLETAEDNSILHSPLSQIRAQVMLPIYDAGFPGIHWLKMAVGIVEVLRETHIVYIHCRAGISRSAMLTAAVLMKKHGWDVDTALNWIASSNPTINPNRSFMQGLRDWKVAGFK